MKRAAWFILFLCAGAALSACGSGAPKAQRPISLDAVPIQYGGGGAVQKSFRVSPAQWEELQGGLGPAADPADERRRICLAIGLMERIAGEQTITWMDKPMNGSHGPREQGQLDCIDESKNTQAYLMLFEQKGLLRWHVVRESVWRAPLLVDTHRTAVVEDVTDGRRYVIDSWFGSAGDPAKTQPLSEWLSKTPFPAD